MYIYHRHAAILLAFHIPRQVINVQMLLMSVIPHPEDAIKLHELLKCLGATISTIPYPGSVILHQIAQTAVKPSNYRCYFP